MHSDTTSTTPAIVLDGVSKRFGSVEALRNINLQVHRGELFGLIGPDGAGKSTIYRILTTLANPDSGSATVGGFDTRQQPRAIRRSVGYMPERFSLYRHLTVKENLEFFASVFGVRVADNYDLIAPIFSQLERFPNRRAGALSGGMKQKLALSCALIHRPDILLLDEPTTGVDAVSRSEFWDMLANLRQHGITIMVSTSYMDEAERCQRIALINGGRILAVDTPRHLTANIGEPLLAARAADMFGLLTALRTLPEVKECYTFGASIHIVPHPGFSIPTAISRLREDGIPDAEIWSISGDIEDLFIKLMRK